MKNIINTAYEFKSEAQIESFVGLCEEDFETQTEKAAAYVLNNAGVKFVALCGPSCSGKTTASKRLLNEFAKAGKIVKTISIDDFYIDRDTLALRAALAKVEIDLDSPTTIDLDYLSECVDRIFNNQPVWLPHYNFMKGMRDSTEEFDSTKADIYIFEGIQTIYPQFREIFKNTRLLTIYISAASEVIAHGVHFSCRDLRLARRIVRDVKYRNSSPEYTLYLWKSVTNNEDIHILPYEHLADITIDSTMAYEPGVIKNQIISVLDKIPESNEYYEIARNIIKKYENIPDIKEKYVPKESIFREFIGVK